MTHVESGYYAPVNRQRVTVWPAPDADGDGEQVWENQFGPNGEPMGRRAVKDKDGKEVFHYEPPKGFLAVPTQQPGSNDPGTSYVREDERGRVWRHPKTGAAAGICEGSVLIEHSNGDFELLTDEYSQYLYARAHEPVKAPEDETSVVPPPDDERVKAQTEADERAEYEEWKEKRRREAEETVQSETGKDPNATVVGRV